VKFLGIIGKTEQGKSLLKILSKVLLWLKYSFEIRVTSLLEVGTGFIGTDR
jgi:ABC-type polysaccharide/polyol phosphate transport system ATPase subunit